MQFEVKKGDIVDEGGLIYLVTEDTTTHDITSDPHNIVNPRKLGWTLLTWECHGQYKELEKPFFEYVETVQHLFFDSVSLTLYNSKDYDKMLQEEADQETEYYPITV